jgi:hypothetical protein
MCFRSNVLLFLLGSIFTGISQETPEYRAGFATVHLVDSSRTYKPGTSPSERLHYRPLDLDIWYPAIISEVAESMLFGDLFRLHEERAVAYQDETEYSGLSDELIMYLAAGFGLEAMDGKRLLKKRTSSYSGARMAAGSFPLIFYMAGYNGMGWESYRLLEQLAENGFVVVSISSIGAYPGDMTNSLENTLEQVYDAEFALSFMEQSNRFQADMARKGILGLSWGGMSGILLLDCHPEIKAMVSLDGSDTFYFGDTEEDDAYLSEIYAAGILDPENTRAAFLHLEAGDRLTEFHPTDEYCYYKKIKSPVWYLRFLKSRHEDFSSIAWALQTNEQEAALYEEIQTTTLRFFREHLKGETVFESWYQKLLQQKSITREPLEYASEEFTAYQAVGKIVDTDTGVGLSYVNIGVIGKEIGAVSDRDGVFQLDLDESHLADTVRISMLGYESKVIPVKAVLETSLASTIRLKETVSELDEVVLTARKWKRKSLGNKTESNFIGHLFHYDQMGKEMGIRMNVGRQPLLVDNFSFHVYHNRFSGKVSFRLNIYRLEGGEPTENLLKENIIIPVASEQTGRIHMDLRPFNIVLTEDVIVTLEWIDADAEVKPTEALAVSVGVLTGGTYQRVSKESEMKKVLRGLGLGYTLDVRY